MTAYQCIFCAPAFKERNLMLQNEIFYSRIDDNPVSEGHALIVPNKHIVSFFDLSDEELMKMYEIILRTQKEE